jgi:hypothetical protein
MITDENIDSYSIQLSNYSSVPIIVDAFVSPLLCIFLLKSKLVGHDGPWQLSRNGHYAKFYNHL